MRSLSEYIKRDVKDNSEFEEFLNTQVAKRLEDSVVYMFITDVKTGTYPVLKLEPFERYGYSVIEWGGAEVTED